MKAYQYIIDGRQRHRLTQKELAEMTGLSLRTIQRIEGGEVAPRAYTVRKIEQALALQEEPKNRNYEPLSNKVTIFKWLLSLSLFLPVVYVISAYLFWKNNDWEEEQQTGLRNTIYWNLTSACLLVPALVLLAMLILRSLGIPLWLRHFPTVLLLYWMIGLWNLKLSYGFMDTSHS
ncbi:MAG: helix-turn-helix domain-containing protein [Bacteroidota bacterium]